ncbi:hypothetical protein JOD57_003367 [Geodermatophilus bullaregiensis]|uniref:toll/interleukin-1 receptor domain-containing protein n=1 Tax=Geodermatophilus bullaregiensis TaxID=1564160 RepID=UPI00195D498B|nr:toll/interleukin-1 receptor domain-containing protein [Geodermatophilus bullaregiensis]MBM7807530.1 hypothetical protein [Geodermatophilus bullaregiensis]
MRLFVSYSRADGPAVGELITDLEQAHLSVWHDRELHGGDPWWQEILERIRACDVFLFALSDHSLASKPCLAELSYARQLGRPVVPVQVGDVSKLRLSPVADIHVVDYRDRTRSGGLALTGAVHEAARERRPLPDPLPEPPPVPFEYLLRLGSAIGAVQLTPDQQGDFIRQLRECLETEDDEAARADARELLGALRRRPDITNRSAVAIDELLAELDGVDGRDGDSPKPGRRWYERPRLLAGLVAGGVLLVLAALLTVVVLLLSATSVYALSAVQRGPDPFDRPAGEDAGEDAVPTKDGRVSGDTPGLYGGSGANTCDAEALAEALTEKQSEAEEWAAVLRLSSVAAIRGYLQQLTPVTLLTDTAVTNHGYREGRAYPYQAVMQAGTAVLIDDSGLPRVRCACGNPLAEPEPPSRADYRGSPWEGLRADQVTVIEPAAERVQRFVVVDEHGEALARPVGSGGEMDEQATAEEAAAAAEMGGEARDGEPGETDPGETDPGETDPGETDPGETDPGETDPGETDPGETDPGETDPGETDPGETDPGETDPGETDPGETDPGETDPGETDPGETDPGETDQGMGSTTSGPADANDGTPEGG